MIDWNIYERCLALWFTAAISAVACLIVIVTVGELAGEVYVWWRRRQGNP